VIIKKELIKREIAGETVLVPVGQAVYDANGLFILNELGAFIWNLLPEVNTADEICKAVLEEYDVHQETAAADIAEFLDKLKTMQIL
jgi:hypothetical protein